MNRKRRVQVRCAAAESAFVAFGCAMLIAASAMAGGPCVAHWDPAIGQPSMAYLNVQVLGIFDDGSGAALYAGGVNAAGIIAEEGLFAKWDGRSWGPVGSGFPLVGSLGIEAPWIGAMAEFDDGTGPGLYVGGNFNAGGDVTTAGIARWKNGEWSGVGDGPGIGPPSLSPGPGVRALAVFDDGRGASLYAAGVFETIGGVSALRIARWDGESWSDVGGGMDGPVLSLAVFDDGSGPALYAGGFFSSAGGRTVNGIARWDGESWSALAAGTTGWQWQGEMECIRIDAMAVFDDGSGEALYAGARDTPCTALYGVTLSPLSMVKKWDGKVWHAIGSNVVLLNTLAVFDDGGGPALYAGGGGGGYGYVVYAEDPSSFAYFERWNGSSWQALDSGFATDAAQLPGWWVPPQDPLPAVHALTAFDEGGGPALVVGGLFHGIGRAAAYNIAQLESVSCTPNDECSGAIPLTDGSIEFDTFHTSTAGPDEPDHCDFLQDTNVHFDLWYSYIATCTGDLTISTCGSGFYTKIAVYADACPEASGEAIACNAGACFPHAEVMLPATAGETFLIRVGGHQGAQGAGVLEIICDSAVPGDFTGDGSVGVDDLLILLSFWGDCADCADCPADLAGDCLVGVDDVLILLANWG